MARVGCHDSHVLWPAFPQERRSRGRLDARGVAGVSPCVGCETKVECSNGYIETVHCRTRSMLWGTCNLACIYSTQRLEKVLRACSCSQSRKRLRNDTVFASPPYLSPQSSEIYCAYPSILCASYIRKSGKSPTRSAGPDGLHFKAPPRHSRHWSRSPCSRLPPRRHARPCRPPAHRSISGKVWARA